LLSAPTPDLNAFIRATRLTLSLLCELWLIAVPIPLLSLLSICRGHIYSSAPLASAFRGGTRVVTDLYGAQHAPSPSSRTELRSIAVTECGLHGNNATASFGTARYLKSARTARAAKLTLCPRSKPSSGNHNPAL